MAFHRHVAVEHDFHVFRLAEIVARGERAHDALLDIVGRDRAARMRHRDFAQAARINYDTAGRRFDVSFEVPGVARASWRFTGTAIETIEAAVPIRALNRGEVIRAGDFTTERRPKSEFSSEPPALAADIAGLAARRTVRAGQPLRNADLMKPEIVQKNDMVLLHYEVPGIVLTMRGKALDSGTQGDMVSVLNIHSKRTIQGIVTGPGRVTVMTPNSARLAAATQ